MRVKIKIIKYLQVSYIIKKHRHNKIQKYDNIDHADDLAIHI